MKKLVRIMIIGILLTGAFSFAATPIELNVPTMGISSGEVFLHRIMKKEEFLKNIAMDIETLLGRSSSTKFVNRLARKEEELARIAITTEELFGTTSGVKFLSRIEKKQVLLKKMAFDIESIVKVSGKKMDVRDQNISNRKCITRLEHKIGAMVSVE